MRTVDQDLLDAAWCGYSAIVTALIAAKPGRLCGKKFDLTGVLER